MQVTTPGRRELAGRREFATSAGAPFAREPIRGILGGVIVVCSLLAVLVAAVGPPVPAGVAEGDLVEIGGTLYQRKGSKLYTLDDKALDDPRFTVTVSGSNLDKNRRAKVVRTESVDGEAMREMGARTLGDVLQQQAGIQVNSSLGLGQEVTLDGLDGRHILILIDGRPVNGRVDNRVDVSRLPISPGAIERIEVVRGPMSALYGSEAIGGVVNIITKKPDADLGGEMELGTRLIVPQTAWSTMGLHGHGGKGPFALRVDVQGQLMPGFDRGGRETGPSIPDGKADVPDRRQLQLSADAVSMLNDNWSIRSTLMGSLSQSSAEVAAAVPFRDLADNAEWALSTGAKGDVGDVGLSLDLRIDRFTHRFGKMPFGTTADDVPAFCGSLIDPACPAEPQVRTDARKDEARLEVRAESTLLREQPFAHELSAAAGGVLLREIAVRQNGGGDDTIPGGGERNVGSLYAEALWRPTEWLALLPGARLDAFAPSSATANQQDAVAVGPKVSLRLDLPWHLLLRAGYGQGFRLPSFEERFLRFDHSELGYVVEGNPALSPERSHGMRAEVAWEPAKELNASVEGALNLLANLITESPNGVDNRGIPLFTYENAARAYTAAVTSRVAVGPWAGARLDASWTFLVNAVNASACPDDNPWLCGAHEGALSLPLRPAHSVDVNLRYTLPATDTTFFFRTDVMSERPLQDGRSAPGSVLLGAGLRQPILEHAELIAGVDNLLDHTDPVFGPKPGRSLNVTLRAWR